MLDSIERLFMMKLPPILDAPDEAAALEFAQMLAQDVQAFLTGPSDWQKRGYAGESNSDT